MPEIENSVILHCAINYVMPLDIYITECAAQKCQTNHDSSDNWNESI